MIKRERESRAFAVAGPLAGRPRCLTMHNTPKTKNRTVAATLVLVAALSASFVPSAAGDAANVEFDMPSSGAGVGTSCGDAACGGVFVSGTCYAQHAIDARWVLDVDNSELALRLVGDCSKWPDGSYLGTGDMRDECTFRGFVTYGQWESVNHGSNKWELIFTGRFGAYQGSC